MLWDKLGWLLWQKEILLLVNHEGNKTDTKERRERLKKGEREGDFLKCSDEMEALSSHEVTKSQHLVAL